MLRAQAEAAYRPISTLRPDVPRALELVVERALQRDPAARFQTAKEMQAALYQALGPRVPGKAASTIVGALLWGELGESNTEITEMLVNPMALPQLPPMPPPVPTRV